MWLPKFAGFADGKMWDILTLVDAITCDNPQGKEFALKYNHNSFIVPDSPNVELFDRFRMNRKTTGNELVIGWIGSPSTLYNLFLIWEPLEVIFKKHSNITWPPFENVKVTNKPFYNEQEMVNEVLDFDIGIFPMFNVEASIFRGILKATVYMSGGVPVIGSPIGQMNELIQDGRNGMLAADSDTWVKTLDQLIANPLLRRNIGENGLRTVRDKFSIKNNFDK